MTDITDPQAIAFCNNQVRPLCESIRALKAQITAATNSWYLGVNSLIPNDTSVVKDNRVAEGVSILTGADVNSAMGDLISAMAALNDQIVQKPCVRVLSVV